MSTRDEEIRNRICRGLIQLSYEGGFGVKYPLKLVFERDPELPNLAVRDVYDSNKEQGVLWKWANSMGLIDVSDDGMYASVNVDTLHELETWSRE